MSYQVRFPNNSLERKFDKALEEVFPTKLRLEIMDAIDKLSANPRPFGNPKIKPPIEAYGFLAQYRIRIGDYRVLYDVDDERKIVWILVLRRRNERTYN